MKYHSTFDTLCLITVICIASSRLEVQTLGAYLTIPICIYGIGNILSNLYEWYILRKKLIKVEVHTED